VRINPNTQAGSRNVLVYFSISNAANLRQGLFAQGSLGTAKVSALTVPLSAVRNDKPTPYVQVIEGNVIKHIAVELSQRGEVANTATTGSRSETVVAVKGLAENAQVLVGSLGALREGTATKFTQAATK
jgi:hypothetical protein